MGRICLLSSPRSIVIADEPLDEDAVAYVAGGVAAPAAFELVPLWQARPHGRRRLWAALPVLAVAAAMALALGRGREDDALRERPAVAATPSSTSARALIVSARPLQPLPDPRSP